MNYPNHGSDALAHHAANAAAVAFPVASIWFRLPEALSVILTLVGIAWYGVLFYDRFFAKKRRHHKV